MRRVLPLLLGATLLAGLEVPSGIFTGDTQAEHAVALRRFLAERLKIDTEAVPGRILAATFAEKTTRAPDGSWAVSSKALSRVLGEYHTWQTYRRICEIIDGLDQPRAYRDLLQKEIGQIFVFPSRQGAPRLAVETLAARYRAIPADGQLVSLDAECTLGQLVADRWPGWSGCTPLQRYLVYRGLAAINPNLRTAGSYRSQESAAGARKVDLGPDLAGAQMLDVLYAIDPELRLAPAGPGAARGDALPVPLGDGSCRVCRFRLPVGGEVLIPAADYLQALAAPERLDLKNCWLADAAVLRDLDPVHLDLRGNDLRDLGPLKEFENLQVLLVGDNPVADLSPLAGLDLTRLGLRHTRVSDLRALAGMPLAHLDLSGTAVADLGPVTDCPLEHLDLHRCAVTDLSPCAGMPLRYLRLDFTVPYTGLPALAATELPMISDVPTAQWIMEWEMRRDGVPPGEIAKKVEAEKERRRKERMRKQNQPDLPGGDGGGERDEALGLDEVLEE